MQAIAGPVALWEAGPNIEANAVDETDNIHGSIKSLGKVEKNPNRAAKFRTKRPGYQIVSTASFDFAVGGNGG